MNLKQLVSSTMLALLISFPAAAQSAAARETSDKEQELKKEREQKAYALLEDVIRDSQALKSPANRLRIQATVADLLWPRDEARARALFKDTAKELADALNEIDASDPQYYMLVQAPSQLRNEILQMLARRDGQMALDFLRSTRSPHQIRSGYQSQDYELNMEMQLAHQIVNNNPKLALQIALESMDEGFSYNLANLVSPLREKDRESAARLADEIVKRLRSENLLKSQEAAGVAVNLLLTARDTEAHGPANSQGQWPSGGPLLDAQTYRDLMDMILTAATKAPTSFNPANWKERNAAQTILGALPPLMPEIEKYAPSSMPALRRKVADFKRLLDPAGGMYQEYQEVFQNGSVDDLLAIVPKVPSEQRQQVFQQAAWKAFNQGDETRARQIISDNLTNPIERRRILEQFERQAVMKALGEGKPEAVRQMVQRLRNPEDRAATLAQAAGVAASKGDKKMALQLLDEARALFGVRAENQSQLNALLYVAQSYAPLDQARGLDIVEACVAQLNDLLAAAEVLNGFDQQYYRDGELIWQGTTLSNLVSQTSNVLGQLGGADFDRASEIAAKLQRPEARIMARLSVAQGVLPTQVITNLPIHGRRIISVYTK